MLSWVTPPGGSPYTLTLPAGTKDQFEKAIALVPPAKREWWRAYRLEADDTLPAVAARFHVSLTALRAANQLPTDDPPAPGTHLLVPLGVSSESSLLRVHERSVLRARLYRVKPGDTLELVADRFDVTPYQIRHWNHLQGSTLTAGRNLTVFVPTPVRSSTGSHSRQSKHRKR
jgi:membrane-bound lytic murein transglycosylase D